MYYIYLFDKLPNKFYITFNHGKDKNTNKITNSFLDDLFGVHVANYICFNYRFSRENRYQNEVSYHDTSGKILFTIDNILWCINDDSICIYYADLDSGKSLAELEDIIIKTWEKLPDSESESKEATVELVASSQGGYYTITSNIKNTDIDIAENYNDDFLPVHDDILKFLETRESGLIMLYGSAGTGKTHYIRYLCSKYPKDYVIVPTSLITRIGDPEFTSFMLDHTDSVFILEDCEQVLVDRKVNMFNGAISNILNMSDGLLSDVMNLKFICTFNADLAEIDPALLRKGRCYAKYEFDKLSEDKVKILNEKYNLNIEEIKPMTLAELYHSDNPNYIPAKNKKIGF